MISAKKLEETGLASIPLKDKTFRITGVNGVVSRCKSWVPGATINLTAGKLATFDDLYVLEDADFEMILGRPWATSNGVNIEEQTRGTYVSWLSDGHRYEINVSKVRQPLRRVAEVVLCRVEEGGEKSGRESSRDVEEEDKECESVRALAVRAVPNTGSNLSYIPDSEASRAAPDLELSQVESLDEEEKAELNRRARVRVEEWRNRDQDDSADADDKREPEERRTPPPNQLGQGKRRAREESAEEEPPESPAKKTRVSQGR